MGTTVQFGQCFKIIYYAYPCLYGSTEGEVGNFKYESEIRLPKGCEFLSVISHWQIEYINQLICVHTIRNLIENKKSEDLWQILVCLHFCYNNLLLSDSSNVIHGWSQL